MKRVLTLQILSFLFLFLVTTGSASSAVTGWAPLNGKVSFNGDPVCAMVLANGQYAFSCSGDGSFSFNVPLDSNGQITVQTYCSGRAPYRITIDPNQAIGMSIALTNTESDNLLDIDATLQAQSMSRCNLSGTVSSNGQPVCAMVLANGQYMFTCSGNGGFNLDVPFDENGQITLYSFCSGRQPYRYDYTSDQINMMADSDSDGYTIAEGDCDDLDPDLNPGSIEYCGDGIDQDCDGSDLPCTIKEGFDGSWSGETSQQHPVGFTVSDNKIMTFSYTVYIPGIVTMSSEISGTPFLEEIDSQNEFSISSNYSYGSYWHLQNGDVTFNGEFTSDSTCIGTFFIDDPSGIITGTWRARSE